MKKIIKGHIDYKKSKCSRDEEFAFNQYDMTDCGFVKIMEYAIEVEIPDDFDLRQKIIAGLKVEELKLRADFEERVTEIKKQISELQSIEVSQ